jgi:hypothetical protein
MLVCSDSQPKRNVSVAGFVAGGAEGVITQITPKPCCMGCRSGTAGGIRPGVIRQPEMRGWKLSFTAQGRLREADEGTFPKITIMGVFTVDLAHWN